MTGSNPLPVRWMAPEAIGDGMYTSTFLEEKMSPQRLDCLSRLR